MGRQWPEIYGKTHDKQTWPTNDGKEGQRRHQAAFPKFEVVVLL
jgi:hypothetical protein